MAEETKQTINIDGKEYNYEDLSEVAQDAIQQLASLQNKQQTLQADYNQLEIKDELFETYLLSKTYLYYGSDSGIFNLSMVNKRPFAFINFPSISNFVKY